MKEIFKDIPNYTGVYQVSNLGRVKSLSRVIKRRSSNYVLEERILKHRVDKKGYPVVGLVKFGKQNTIEVHKLVAITFLNHTPCGYKLVVDHIDNVRHNNNLNNLQIITHRENISKNPKRNKSSRYVGVSWNKNNKKYSAQIKVGGKRIWLGSFNCEEKASLVYRDYLKMLNL